MEFLEVLDTVRVEEASVRRLFGGEGTGVRHAQGRDSAGYMKKLAETARFIEEVLNGRRPAYHLQEAMGTDDFPLLFGDILDRQLLANYQETNYSWDKIVRRRKVRDFRSVKRHAIAGGDGTLDEVAQFGAYPEDKLNESTYDYQVKKHGRQMPFSWEAIVNDDLDALNDVPERFGRASRRSEEKFVTEMFFDENGPKATFFKTANKNLISGNPVLDPAGIQDGLTLLAKQVDESDQPIHIDAVTLWVPTALQFVAMNILNALQIEMTSKGGSATQKLIVANWIKNKLTLAVGPYISTVANAANGDTGWGLFAQPEAGRGAGEIGFLRGHEAPEIFMKAPNVVSVGGGAAGPMTGDFDTDSIQYKVRHVFGGTEMDPKMAVASKGSGA